MNREPTFSGGSELQSHVVLVNLRKVVSVTYTVSFLLQSGSSERIDRQTDGQKDERTATKGRNIMTVFGT